MLSDIYRCSDDIVVREIVGETLLVPISGRLANMARIFSLNSTGVFIWQRIDGVTPVMDIRDDLIDAFGINTDEAESDLGELIQELLDAQLIKKAN